MSKSVKVSYLAVGMWYFFISPLEKALLASMMAALALSLIHIYINKADFVACHNPSYVTKDFPMVRDVKPGGVFMINCQWSDEELAHHLSAEAKRYIAENDIQLYTINAIDLAQQIGMGKRTNTILQSAFFTLAKVMPQEEAIQMCIRDSFKIAIDAASSEWWDEEQKCYVQPKSGKKLTQQQLSLIHI